MDSIQGFRVSNTYQNLTLKNVQNQAQALVLSHLNRKNTYKVKSGFFKVEDSVSIGKITDKLNASRDSLDVLNLQRGVTKTIREFSFLNKDNPSNFTDAKYYKYRLKNTIVTDSSMFYVVAFSTKKSKAKFNGTLHINADDFGVTKIEYQYAKEKKGQHLNLRMLLGVKFSENYRKGTFLFEKKNKYYHLKYAKEKKGRYFYINRSLKFIENSRDRSKIKFGIKIEGNFFTTTEMVAVKTTLIDVFIFKKLPKIKKILIMTSAAYNAAAWKNGKLLNVFKNKEPQITSPAELTKN